MPRHLDCGQGRVGSNGVRPGPDLAQVWVRSGPDPNRPRQTPRHESEREPMFTRRQAIRWAELWVSCWNEGDYETLLALYRDTSRFGTRSDESILAHDNTIEALKRHWAAVPFGIHSVRGELERVSWDPEMQIGRASCRER